MAVAPLLPCGNSLGSSFFSSRSDTRPRDRAVSPKVSESSKSGSFLTELPAAAVQEFEFLGIHKRYEAGSLLFIEGQAAEYVYFVIDGAIKLSINSPDGHRLTYRIAHQDELIGMAAVFLDTAHDSTAEAIHACRIAAVAKREFFAFLLRHPQAQSAAMKALSVQSMELCDTLRSVSLNASAPSKLAHLLLKWSETAERTEYGSRVRFFMSHTEVGQFIGASRETVTRTLAKFKRDHLIEVHGSVMTIPDKPALERIAGA